MDRDDAHTCTSVYDFRMWPVRTLIPLLLSKSNTVLNTNEKKKTLFFFLRRSVAAIYSIHFRWMVQMAANDVRRAHIAIDNCPKSKSILTDFLFCLFVVLLLFYLLVCIECCTTDVTDFHFCVCVCGIARIVHTIRLHKCSGHQQQQPTTAFINAQSSNKINSRSRMPNNAAGNNSNTNNNNNKTINKQNKFRSSVSSNNNFCNQCLYGAYIHTAA